MKLKVDKHKLMHKVKIVVTMYTTMTSSKLAINITEGDLEVTVFVQQCQFSDRGWSKPQIEHQE